MEDRWILSEFAETMNRVETAWTGLDIYTTQALKTFGTGILPSHGWKCRSQDCMMGMKYGVDYSSGVRDLMSTLSPVCPFFTHHTEHIV